MNIIVVSSPWMGGSGSVAFDLAKSYAALGHRVDFVSYGSSYFQDGHVPNLYVHVVEPYSYPLFPFPLYELSLAERIIEIALQHNTDVIHAHYSIVFGQAALQARNALRLRGKRVRLMLTVHGSDVVGSDYSLAGTTVPRYVNELVFNESDVLTAVSHDLVVRMHTYYSVTRDVHVVRNAVAPIMNTRTPRRGGEIQILHVSNFRPVKNTFLLPRIAAALSESGLTYRFKLVGDGPDMHNVQAEVSRLGLDAQFEFLGPVRQSEIAQLYTDSDITVISSKYESAPLVALESLAAGTPVVSSDVGGVSEIVKGGETGYLVRNSDDPQAFANSILRCAESLCKSEATSAVLKQSVLAYTPLKIAEQYLALLGEHSIKKLSKARTMA
jgi:N-acetyl-alpha-D-glucosaminyl L-malate synthase BshA